MDINHDYDGTNELLLVGRAERLQMCKCIILAFGDLGYTDPAIPSINSVLGEYTDAQGISTIENRLHEVLVLSQVVREDEIVSINVMSPPGEDHFIVDLQFIFGSTTFDLSNAY